jgi:hypothetical protein
MLEAPLYETLPVRESKFRETYADNLLELSHELGVEAGLKGSYGGVTASVSSKFLKQQLDPEFKSALNTSDPAELFSEYGTHLVRKIRIGGRAEYFCQSTATSRMTSDEFKIAAKAKKH